MPEVVQRADPTFDDDLDDWLRRAHNWLSKAKGAVNYYRFMRLPMDSSKAPKGSPHPHRATALLKASMQRLVRTRSARLGARTGEAKQEGGIDPDQSLSSSLVSVVCSLERQAWPCAVAPPLPPKGAHRDTARARELSPTSSPVRL